MANLGQTRRSRIPAEPARYIALERREFLHENAM